jgi:hypothetical protein
MKMQPVDIGVDSWIIQDGNYTDFAVDHEAQFALEFYPISLKGSDCRCTSGKPITRNLYDICGQVVYLTEDVLVLDMSVLAYQECEPPDFASQGSWVAGQVYLGIDLPLCGSRTIGPVP